MSNRWNHLSDEEKRIIGGKCYVASSMHGMSYDEAWLHAVPKARAGQPARYRYGKRAAQYWYEHHRHNLQAVLEAYDVTLKSHTQRIRELVNSDDDRTALAALKLQARMLGLDALPQAVEHIHNTTNVGAIIVRGDTELSDGEWAKRASRAQTVAHEDAETNRGVLGGPGGPAEPAPRGE